MKYVSEDVWLLEGFASNKIIYIQGVPGLSSQIENFNPEPQNKENISYGAIFPQTLCLGDILS